MKNSSFDFCASEVVVVVGVVFVHQYFSGVNDEQVETQRTCSKVLDANCFDYMKQLIEGKKLQEVRLLTSSEGREKLIGMRDWKNQTLLHVSACVDNIELRKMLINVGLDVEWRDNNGQTFAHEASMYGNVNCLHHVCQHYPRLINLKDKWYGFTCLHFSVHNKRLRSVQILLEHNANLNIKDKEGQTSRLINLQDNKGQACLHSS